MLGVRPETSLAVIKLQEQAALVLSSFTKKYRTSSKLPGNRKTLDEI